MSDETPTRSIPVKTHVARWRCIDCGKAINYAATKGKDLLMYTCQHVDADTGLRCNSQHKMSRAKSRKLIQRYLETSTIIDLNKELIITHGKPQNLNRPPERPDPQRAAGGGGGRGLYDLYDD